MEYIYITIIFILLFIYSYCTKITFFSRETYRLSISIREREREGYRELNIYFTILIRGLLAMDTVLHFRYIPGRRDFYEVGGEEGIAARYTGSLGGSWKRPGIRARYRNRNRPIAGPTSGETLFLQASK